MWALGAAPLIIAVDVANMTTVRVMVLSRCSAHSSLANPSRAMHQTQRETLLNPEVAAMHQDPLGDPGKRVAEDHSCVQHSPPPKKAASASNPPGIYPPW